MPDRTWITMSFPTPLFFRYHLPLMVHSGALGSLYLKKKLEAEKLVSDPLIFEQIYCTLYTLQ